MKLHVESCPFCGCSDDVEFTRGTPDREGIPTTAICVGCGAAGPGVYESSERNFMGALDAWNYREVKKLK